MPAREERVAGSIPGFGFPLAEDDLLSMRSDDRSSGEEPQGEREVGPAPTRDPPRLASGVIGGVGPGRTCAILKGTMMVGLCRDWCFSCLIDQNLSRMELGFRNKSRQEFYGQWRLMKFALNDFWMPCSTRKSHNLKDRIRD